ncbi:MAG TPA: hypothetical protein DCY13_13990, partial [Verrucomicrobiales bacterium]|nr:hypothetical protein [Verrucomicrobiales bacterium]
LPANGALFQTSDGVTKGPVINAVPTVVTDPQRRVIYEPTTDFTGQDAFLYVVNDGQEDSGEATFAVTASAGNTLPVANDDVVNGFENTPLVINNLLANDTDADGDPLRVVIARPPTNGVLVANPDGSFTYTPNPGFSGTDEFTYAVADAVSWNRNLDFTPGTTPFTTEGNPDDDAFGNPVWQMESVQGGGLSDPNLWYAAVGQKLVWDSSWFGSGAGLWARGDDASPPIGSTALTHNIADSGLWPFIPLVRWLNPFGAQSVDVVGTLAVGWSGNGGVGSPVAVDVVIGRRATGTGIVTALYTNTVNKPTPGDSMGDQRLLPVDLRNMAVGPGDQLMFTLRAHNAVGGRWINLHDQLTVLPSSPTRYATVTVNVDANAAPQVTHSPGGALRLDGLDDHLSVPTSAAVNPTQAMSLEAWVFAENLNASQIGIAGTWDDLAGANRTYLLWVQGGRLEFLVNTAAGFSRAAAPAVFPTGRWVHVAGTYDGADIRLYIDGELVATVAASGLISTNNRSFFIGRVDGGSNGSDFFPGRIDEVRLWNRALSATEVLDGMHLFQPADANGLAGYWQFDGPDPGTDSTLNGLDGVLVNGASLVPSTVPVGPVFEVDEDADLTLTLSGTDGDNDPLTAIVNAWPRHGQLYQTSDGTTRGAALTGDQARDFDGSDDIITIAESSGSNLGGRSALTIAAWIFPRSTSQSFPTIYSEGHWRVSLGLKNGTTKLDSWINNGNELVSTGDLRFNQWNHVALTHDGVERRFYINGQFAGSGGAPAVGADNVGAAIGGVIDELSNSRNRFDGLIDEVTLWNAALDESQVRGLAGNRVTGAEAGLIAWWPLNEATSADLVDATGGGSDAVAGAGVASRMPGIQLNTAAPYAGLLPRVSDAAGRVIFAPDGDFFGVDSLRYRVNDGKVDSLDGYLSIRVRPVNDAPVALGDHVFALQGLPQFIGNVLTNDFDIEGSPISVFDFTQPVNGSVTSNAPGVFVYTSHAGFVGEDMFSYRITDGTTNSGIAVVSVTVAPLDEFRWVNPAGGNWNVAANWSQNRVPGPDDSVVIDLDGDYTVTLDVNAAVRRVVVGGESGNQTLDVNGRQLSLATDSFIRSNAVLRLPSGTLNAGPRLNMAGRLEWTGGAMTGPGVTRIETVAHVNVSGATNKDLSAGRVIENAGTMVVSGANLFFNLNNLGGGAIINNLAGGVLELQGETDLTHNFSSVSAVNNAGLL